MRLALRLGRTLGPEAAGSLVQLIDQRVQAVMLSMRRDGGMLSG
ncbi:hypothetical protein P3512_21600 [Escherichia coli]|nr:hypothetical protein [Escherichia coli]MDF4126092.1 hypothetical protein [Escherichia coli]